MARTRVALLVEDDPSLQKAVAAELKGEGFEVLLASDHESAVVHLAEHVPDIVCLDLGLPRESGYELCEHIRKHPGLSGVPVLVMSERGFPEDMAHAEEAGANAFLKKPFKMSALTKYVSALLDGDKASRPSIRRLRRSE